MIRGLGLRALDHDTAQDFLEFRKTRSAIRACLQRRAELGCCAKAITRDRLNNRRAADREAGADRRPGARGAVEGNAGQHACPIFQWRTCRENRCHGFATRNRSGIARDKEAGIKRAIDETRETKYAACRVGVNCEVWPGGRPMCG